MPFFAEHGVRVQRVLTDNAKASTDSMAFAEGAADLGISIKRTRCYRPQTYGKADQLPVLGPGQRRGHRVVAVGVPHAQQVEEVPGQDQLDGPLVVVEFLQQHGELRGGLEDVAAR
jgi:hypothetical protein